MTTRTRRSVVALALAAATLAGCGGGSDDNTTGGKPKDAGPHGVGLVMRAGTTAQFADCTDWRRGTVAQRRVTIRNIRGQLTPQRSKTAESALSDDAAYRIFNKTCSTGIADSLRLYKLYARAQAFAPLTRDEGSS